MCPLIGIQMFRKKKSAVVVSDSKEISGATDTSVTIDSITFSDGSKVSLSPNDVVVIVGPNNAGKSALLKELDRCSKGGGPGKVMTALQVNKVGDAAGFVDFLSRNSKLDGSGPEKYYRGFGFRVSQRHAVSAWENTMGDIGEVFFRLIGTGDRLSGSNPVSPIDTLHASATHPIHEMYVSSDIESGISKYFREAFGQDIFVYHLGGGQWPLFVGQKPSILVGENSTSNSYLERVRSTCFELSLQGDGMRSYATIVMHVMASKVPTVSLLDEPEAFLHPPQARILGEHLARTDDRRGQLLIATHSPDVLSGLLSVPGANLKIVRLTRQADVNKVSVLDNESASQIANDPLMKYSGVLSGIFHKRVFICEGDSDCLFYNAVLAAKSVRGNESPDALFVHGGGKQRMAPLVSALRALDVTVDVIADIDVLNDEAVISKLVTSLGADWSSLKAVWRLFYKEIEAKRAPVKPAVAFGIIEDAVKIAKERRKLDEETSTQIRDALKTVSPWDALKEAGESAIPAGPATIAYQDLKARLAQVGLWLVPVGQLEGFSKSIPQKYGWVQKVLEEMQVEDGEELAAAREFVRTIWASRPN